MEPIRGDIRPMPERNNGHRSGEGSGVVAPNPSFLVNKTRFLHANRKSTSLENAFALEHQPACKPGFVGHRLLAQTVRDGHSSGTMFAHCLKQPTRTASLTTPCGVIAHWANVPALPSLFGFAPGVVCHAVSVAGPAVRSYRTFSPLLRRSPEGRRRAVRSLWHCPWGCPRRTLSGTVCRWSPDFPPQPPFGDCRSGRPAD
jgi:hypothetical protein